jgi:hypothetical protein
MTVLVWLLTASLALALVLWALLASEPAKLAGAIRSAGPLVLAGLGGALLFAGLAAVGGIILFGAVAWYGIRGSANPRRGASRPHSTVRTAALEIKLDHATGRLEGLVLAGRHEGETLGAMPLAALRDLHREIRSDPESRQLIETYLDGRFPVWREDPDADADLRLRAAPRPGAMTKQEAYQILGLEAGAGAAEIRQAHRRLMQRVHADIGGSSFLAARIDEAKDVLLSDHG